jgi:hypothetical protein
MFWKSMMPLARKQPGVWRFWGFDIQKVNPNGGAIAWGHPGAQQIATLWHELHRRKQRHGVISMCIGTRMGAAAVLEVETESRLYYLILLVLDTNRIDIYIYLAVVGLFASQRYLSHYCPSLCDLQTALVEKKIFSADFQLESGDLCQALLL